MTTVAECSGLDMVLVQGSAADVRKGDRVTRDWRWVKDLNVSPAKVMKSPNDIVAFVDVDYYIDMPKFLASHFRPVIMYTFQPSKAASIAGEYKYRFLKNNEIEYEVSGGGKYVHKVWNYDGDAISTVRKFCGVPISYSTYFIERKRADDDHQIVLISPNRKFRGLYAWLAMWQLGDQPLRRLEPVQGDFVRLDVNSQSGLNRSTSKVAGYLACTIPVELDEAVESTNNTCARKLTLAAVKGTIFTENDQRLKGAEILHEYYLTRVAAKKPARVSVLDPYVRGYQYIDKPQQYDPESNQGMISFMKPLVHGGFVADVTKMNEKIGVRERVLNPQKKVSEVEVDKFALTMIREWIAMKKRYLPSGLLHPVDEDYVRDKQNKPSQIAILDRASHDAPTNQVDSFGKKEAVGRVNYQRNITTMPPREKLAYAQFMYAYTDYTKQQPWYAFGRKPVEIAESVANVCVNATTHVLNQDYSFYDGTKNKVFKMKHRMEYMQLFAVEYRSRLSELIRKQTDRRGKTRTGVTYNTGDSQCSGSSDTSVANTDDNAFTTFTAFRRSINTYTNTYYTAEEAFSALGLFGGDDGIQHDLSKDIAESTARRYGLQLKVEVIPRGTLGVQFLSRHYGPDVWFGDLDSVCSIKRQLSKFHLTVNLSTIITKEKKLFDKAYSLSLSDSNTPVVGAFVRTVVSLFTNTVNYTNVCNIWNGDVDKALHYPNEYGNWMEDVFNNELPDFDLVSFDTWIRNATTQTIFYPHDFNPSLDSNPKPGLVVVDGDMVQVVPASNPPSVASSKKRRKRGAKQQKETAKRPARKKENYDSHRAELDLNWRDRKGKSDRRKQDHSKSK
jgi:hypothetical protein